MKKHNLNIMGKRLWLPALALAAAIFPLSARHLVLLEKFTNVGCAPCAIIAPPCDSLLDQRIGDVVEIAYHGPVPYPNDEYYLPVREQVQHRIDFYNVFGYPTFEIDGSVCQARISDIGNRIDALSNVAERARLTLSAEVKDGVLTARCDAASLADLPENVRLFMVAVEEEVIPSRPAFNGQTEFHNEFRQFLTSPQGERLQDFGKEGSSSSWSAQWEIERMEREEELAVVAWLQDMATKEVIETAYLPRRAKAEEGARVMRCADIPAVLCAPVFSGKVWIRNTGSRPMTSCDLVVKIGEKEKRFPWSGNLAYLETEMMEIPPFTDFELDEEGNSERISIRVDAINGGDSGSEPLDVEIAHTLVGHGAIELNFTTDNKPEENSWKLFDASGNMIAESEPFTERRKAYVTMLPLSGNGCYRLEFSDRGGDGITGSFGKGFFRLTEIDGEKRRELLQSDFTGASHSLEFRLASASGSGVGAATADGNGFMVYDSSLHSLCVERAGVVSVCSLDGRMVLTRSLEAGESLDMGGLAAGIYVVTLSADSCGTSITISR